MASRKKSGLYLKNIVTERGGFTLRVPDLHVVSGKIVCVVGPNGGGKTTLLLTALGLLPHQGVCTVNGQQFDGTSARIKADIGFIPDDPELMFTELTAREQWRLTASVIARQKPDLEQAALTERAEDLASMVSFTPPATVARQYSHGMRKKTQLVNALLSQPSVIVVDELRNGLDPIAIKQTEELIKSERHRGAAILAATHDLWWAERFADYIYIINRGQIAAHGTLGDLLDDGESHLEDVFFRIVKADNAEAM